LIGEKPGKTDLGLLKEYSQGLIDLK